MTFIGSGDCSVDEMQGGEVASYEVNFAPSSFPRRPDVARNAEKVRRRSPEGVREANHPCFVLAMDSGLRRNDDEAFYRDLATCRRSHAI